MAVPGSLKRLGLPLTIGGLGFWVCGPIACGEATQVPVLSPKAAPIREAHRETHWSKRKKDRSIASHRVSRFPTPPLRLPARALPLPKGSSTKPVRIQLMGCKSKVERNGTLKLRAPGVVDLILRGRPRDLQSSLPSDPNINRFGEGYS